jgi:hypothetical protein
VQVSVGDAGNVWAVNAGGQAFKWQGGGNWENKGQGGVARVAVSSGGGKVFAVGADARVLAWNGGDWTVVPGALVNVSANDSCVVGANSGGQVFCAPIPRPAPPPPPPAPMGGMGMGMGMGMGGGGGAWARSLAGACAWTQVDGRAQTVSVGAGDAVWATTEKNIYRRNGFGAPWEQVPGGADQVDAQSYHSAVAVNSNDDIYQFVNGNWAQLPGKASWASIGSDGAIWAVNRGQQIFRYMGGGNWETVPGSAVQVSVGDAGNVWAVNAGGQAFKWQGGGNWDNVPGPAFSRVAVSGGGARVVAVGADQRVFGLAEREWVPLPGALVNVSVGDTHIIGANAGGELYRVAIPAASPLPGGGGGMGMPTPPPAWTGQPHHPAFPPGMPGAHGTPGFQPGYPLVLFYPSAKKTPPLFSAHPLTHTTPLLPNRPGVFPGAPPFQP